MLKFHNPPKAQLCHTAAQGATERRTKNWPNSSMACGRAPCKTMSKKTCAAYEVGGLAPKFAIFLLLEMEMELLIWCPAYDCVLESTRPPPNKQAASKYQLQLFTQTNAKHLDKTRRQMKPSANKSKWPSMVLRVLKYLGGA